MKNKHKTTEVNIKKVVRVCKNSCLNKKGYLVVQIDEKADIKCK